MKNKILIICSEDGYKREQFRKGLQLKTKDQIKILSGISMVKDKKNQFYLPNNFNPYSILVE